ncbi:MAG: aspartate carbamoyltransferase regulatory subunit [Paludibacteraceae bacterium]|jgi:aspartate carbamoyltransferase, regulatory subunit|nr:aspartate carbamoyltransferase regulatory subunit [Paludibacteraceae bacterium]MBP5480318.1 aspartate carbamoyltransferase regulatory subunit [Paludibacteraceae bacterium]MBR3520391.1 aspartate carbamoyltransferase regulatory subunit [Paludibacteraceae bacterium]MBR4714383.1 aspartate carbamoyltransferase regulatory subunit [Paludibacteraceae bacterium]MBR5695772.1 aspartate carbamoyltransferase regulatory subunit [Paludibacteraceae bacterium]
MEKEKGTKELKVAALKNGTVIDHIPSEKLFKVISILGLEHLPNQVTFGYNLESKRLGKKAIIKVADKYFTQAEVNKIAITAPSAKINIIKDYEVSKKMELQLPDEIIGTAKCRNPKCITNNEPMLSKFRTIDKSKALLKCFYCERIAQAEELEIL